MILQAPKGFRDYLPKDALRRKFVVDKITKVFEKFGFDPLETPTLEYEATLTGKYGEEEKLIYKFKTPGGDKVALKYDQTVPLARVVAQYGPNGQQILPIPFKRYQIQPAYRGENTQKGRYREFVQCDFDIVGNSTPLADAEILAVIFEIYQGLGLKVILKVNDRTLFEGIATKYLAALDKLDKIGNEGVIDELIKRGLSAEEAKKLFERVTTFEPTQNLKEIMTNFEKLGYPNKFLKFEPTLVRGLDYYTGLIMETVLVSNPKSSSVGGGGRWDKMIGKFTGVDLPATGYSVGLDRVVEAMEEDKVFDSNTRSTKVLVTIFNSDLMEKSVEAVSQLRSNNISAEIWLDPTDKLDKQLKYADAKNIPYVAIIGPEEAEKNVVTLKDLNKKSQATLTLDELVSKLLSK